MKNHTVITNTSQILLALLTLQGEQENNHDRATEDPSIPLGSLYNRVSNDNDKGWIELHHFNTSIENLQEAGLINVNTPEAVTGPTSTNATKTSHAKFTATTQLRTVALTPAGRVLAEAHPEWSTNEVQEHAIAAAGGSRR